VLLFAGNLFVIGYGTSIMRKQTLDLEVEKVLAIKERKWQAQFI
jgi:hypothetical protein